MKNSCSTLKVLKASKTDIFSDSIRVNRKFRCFSKSGDIIFVHVNGIREPLIARGVREESDYRDCDVVWLDERTRDKLKLNINCKYKFKFSEAGKTGALRWFWFASEPSVKIAARLSMMSISLGVIGLIIGICSVF